MNEERNRAGMRRTLSFSIFTAVLVLSALAGYMLPVAADDNGDNGDNGDDFSDLLLPNYVFYYELL